MPCPHDPEWSKTVQPIKLKKWDQKGSGRRHTGLPPQVQCRAANLASRGPTWGLVAVGGDGQTATTRGTEPPACDQPRASMWHPQRLGARCRAVPRAPRSREWKEAGLPSRVRGPLTWASARSLVRSLQGSSEKPAPQPRPCPVTRETPGRGGERAGKGARGRAVVERRWPSPSSAFFPLSSLRASRLAPRPQGSSRLASREAVEAGDSKN